MTYSGQMRENLGRNVESLREDQRLTKVALAKMSGVSRPFLNKVEYGLSDARLSYVQRLADVLCVSPLELLTPPDNPDGVKENEL